MWLRVGVSSKYQGRPPLGSSGFSTSGVPFLDKGFFCIAAMVKDPIIESEKVSRCDRFTKGAALTAVTSKSPFTVKHEAETNDPLIAAEIPK